MECLQSASPSSNAKSKRPVQIPNSNQIQQIQTKRGRRIAFISPFLLNLFAKSVDGLKPTACLNSPASIVVVFVYKAGVAAGGNFPVCVFAANNNPLDRHIVLAELLQTVD